jgi:hypothetical protein
MRLNEAALIDDRNDRRGMSAECAGLAVGAPLRYGIGGLQNPPPVAIIYGEAR